MSSSMCRATLFPDPDSPLTMINRIDMDRPALYASARPEDFLGTVVGGLFLVFLDAAVELVGKRVDGSIHVLFDGIRVDLVTPHHQGRFGLVSHFFDGEYAMDVDQLLEMAGDAFEFLENVAAQRGCDFHM